MSHKPVETKKCEQCGHEMLDYQSHWVCPNCGAKVTCSDCNG